MNDVTVKLISISKSYNSIGALVETKVETEVPIIRIEDIYENEYYKANESGYKPTLRLCISTLNYNDEEELIYNNIEYSIIRKQKQQTDEMILICERKIKNA